jgi:hypothetical protein
MTCNCSMFNRHRKDMQRIVRKKIADLERTKTMSIGERTANPVRIIQESRIELLYGWLKNVTGAVAVKRVKPKKLRAVA